MSNIAIRVENLSKLYHIGKAQQRHDTLRDTLGAGLRSSTRFLRRNGQASNNETEDNLWALKDVSFEVKRGEVVGIPSLRSGQALAATPQRVVCGSLTKRRK